MLWKSYQIWSDLGINYFNWDARKERGRDRVSWKIYKTQVIKYWQIFSQLRRRDELLPGLPATRCQCGKGATTPVRWAVSLFGNSNSVFNHLLEVMYEALVNNLLVITEAIKPAPPWVNIFNQKAWLPERLAPHVTVCSITFFVCVCFVLVWFFAWLIQTRSLSTESNCLTSDIFLYFHCETFVLREWLQFLVCELKWIKTNHKL